MIHVANPIYDSVFKYLMEDERIAKTLLSALLKKEVVDVKVRRHEYTNGTRDNLSMFRIDFGAQVKEKDGNIHLILIELQKTWLETETLRFRQYLGAQYANPENILKEDNPRGYGIPMITVYLLGHRIGDIEEPVLYVNHKAFNYEGSEVKKGIPDPFVDSLVHDSIIVQIPLLNGLVNNNRLLKVLSVFDQTQKDKFNRQVLNLDEDKYEGDDEMLYILRRLLSAASDSKLRQDMNVEDEYFLAIENRDTELMIREKKIIEKEKKIAENKKVIAENKKVIAENKKVIAEQGAQIAEQGAQMQSMIQLLHNKGMSIEEIALSTGIDTEKIQKML